MLGEWFLALFGRVGRVMKKTLVLVVVCCLVGLVVGGLAVAKPPEVDPPPATTPRPKAAAPQSSVRFSSVSGGGGHTCGLTSGGGVRCWGHGNRGQLGNGSTADRAVSTQVSGLTSGLRVISAGDAHTCAVTSGDGVLCWGYNAQGKLGDGTTTERHVPTPVSGLASGVVSVSAGKFHTCAVTSAGGVLCWGYNSFGQLGDGTQTTRHVPTPVSGLASGVVAVSAGGDHTCVVTSAGGVLCWGYNSFGQLGDGTTTNCHVPTPVSGLASGVVSVSAGEFHTCAVTSAGGVRCWGSNSYGKLGDGTTVEKHMPTRVQGTP